MQHNIKFITSYFDAAKLGEGIFCDVDPLSPDNDSIFWVDILGDAIYQYNPGRETAKLSFLPRKPDLGSYPSTITALDSTHKHFLISMRNGLVVWDSVANKFVGEPLITNLESNQRFNDGKCDASGVFWIGTTHLDSGSGEALLYKLVKNNNKYELELKLDNLSISNGIAWSQNGKRMYYIDTPQRQIWIFKYENNEIPKDKVAIIDLSKEKGLPDGMTIDSLGNLWIAMWDGSQIINVDTKSHKVIDRIELPISRPTNVAISPTHKGRFYITSAMVQDEPDSGHLLQLDTFENIKGDKSNYFKLEDHDEV